MRVRFRQEKKGLSQCKKTKRIQIAFQLNPTSNSLGYRSPHATENAVVLFIINTMNGKRCVFSWVYVRNNLMP